MAEPTQYLFSLKEVAQVLMLQHGIHEGIWTVGVEFNFTATSAGPSIDELTPSAIIGVSKIALTKTDKENSLSFDASILNPGKKGPTRGARKTSERKR